MITSNKLKRDNVFSGNQRKILLPYITAGDPDLKTTFELVLKLEAIGASGVEIGVPFSDSLADGPVIVASHHRALKNKVNLAQVLELIEQLRTKTAMPLFLMLSYNLIYKFGVDKFVQEARRVQVSGYIIPDLPIEETPMILKPNYLITPTTSVDRQKILANKTAQFVYLVSSIGTTGIRSNLDPQINQLITMVKQYTKKSVLVGFGISSALQAQLVGKIADGVIIGSALIEKLQLSETQGLDFIKEVRQSLDGL